MNRLFFDFQAILNFKFFIFNSLPLSKHFVLILSLAISIPSCSPKESASFRCSDYDWSSIEQLVFPYLDEDMQTAMTMQAQSSEYHVSAAADFALTFEEDYPDSLVSLLGKIEECE